MPAESLKIIIPMAGLGTRLRPHTWSRPKQLIQVAGKPVLSHVLDQFDSLPPSLAVEYIFVVGYLQEQIVDYMARSYPDLRVNYVVQQEPAGQSQAIQLTRRFLRGPMLLVFADTLINPDFSTLGAEEAEAIAWVKPVEDPRRFGVAALGEAGQVSRIIEKPDTMDNKLAVVGFYYFRQAEAVAEAVEAQLAGGITRKGEFFFADAVNLLLDRGLQMRAEEVHVYFDAGTPADLLEMNRYLLDGGRGNSQEAAAREGVVVIPPVFIHPRAQVEASVIGPHVSIGADCIVRRSALQAAILEPGAQVSDAILQETLLGERARVRGRASIINLGDDSEIAL